ncbi:glutamate 5-kinase [Gammaproteobacteria bacterium]|nr:glutamate 5-kinase [Gammaproteobacteria bacterium]
MSRDKPHSYASLWVVKIGSALLTDDGRGLNTSLIADWARQIKRLIDDGTPVLVVSSGAIAEGTRLLGWTHRPADIHLQQAAAAVGQMGLIRAWETAFATHDLRTAQILLTHADVANRERYLNARSALKSLLDLGVVPVINENDTVITDEIRLGDNDSLGALVANLIDADRLLILTDQQGVFTADPRHNPTAELIEDAESGDPLLYAVAGSGGSLGRGGMVTKVRAAELASASGTVTIIASGREERVIERLYHGESIGTRIRPKRNPITARKRWLAGQMRSHGELYLDEGAVRVVREQGRSVLPVGVTRASGRFGRGDMVRCIGPDGTEVARGLVNYNQEEASRIVGLATRQIAKTLGYAGDDELIHRDNLVVTT